MKPAQGIYLRGKIWWLRFQRDGVRYRRSLETSDPRQALSRAMDFKNRPEHAAKSELRAEVERYLAYKRRMNIFSRATERVSGAALREFCAAIGDTPARSVLSTQIESHYQTLRARVAETTAQIHMRSIRAFFSWCVEQRLCMENPAKAVKLATIDQPARLVFCTADERDLLIRKAPTRDLRFILFAGFHCGMRKGEIIEARVGWFDLHDGGACHIENTPTFRIKDRDARFVPITSPFRRFLRGFLAGKDRAAFVLRPEVTHGKGTYRYDFHRPFNDYMAAMRLRRVTAHVMRHTFASLLVQNGVSVFKVARWLGDGVEVVEKHYAHLTPQDLDIERML